MTIFFASHPFFFVRPLAREKKNYFKLGKKAKFSLSNNGIQLGLQKRKCNNKKLHIFHNSVFGQFLLLFKKLNYRCMS